MGGVTVLLVDFTHFQVLNHNELSKLEEHNRLNEAAGFQRGKDNLKDSDLNQSLRGLHLTIIFTLD